MKKCIEFYSALELSGAIKAQQIRRKFNAADITSCLEIGFVAAGILELFFSSFFWTGFNHFWRKLTCPGKKTETNQ